MCIQQTLFRILIALFILFGINQPLHARQDQDATPLKDANSWINKGDLCAVYGNDKAAIRYYRKALELEPNNSRTLFHLGISYGEVGRYSQAIAFINKALAINSLNGIYYYGRGRVRLLSGEREKAIEDFKQAAVLSNRDAQHYLQNTLKIEWQ